MPSSVSISAMMPMTFASSRTVGILDDGCGREHPPARLVVEGCVSERLQAPFETVGSEPIEGRVNARVDLGGLAIAQGRQLSRDPKDRHQLDVGDAVGAGRERDRIEDGVVDRRVLEHPGEEVCGNRHGTRSLYTTPS
jgi:hypothetical protein